MNDLHVIDMSPAVYAGSFNTHSFISGDVINDVNGYREQRIPTGGTSMLFNILGQYMGTGDIAFVADRQPTIKTDRFPFYKGNRTHPHNVEIAKQVAEFILSDCGFTIHARDGYEADDVVFSIVKANHERYDHIYVHTGDSDLYLLVDEKVSILPTSSQAKTVTMANYERMCKANTHTPYNTVVFQKFLHGDRGKNVDPLPISVTDKLIDAMLWPKFMPSFGSIDIPRAFLSVRYPELVPRLEMMYPLFINEPWHIQPEGKSQRVKEWAYEIGNRKVPAQRGDLSQQIAQMLQEGLYLD